MKQFIISLLLIYIILVSKTNVQAQQNKVMGIFNSANDFKSGVFSKKINCNAENKIKVDVFLNSSDIIVKENGVKTKIKKSTIYGYQNSLNENFRFYNNTEYMIIDTGKVYLYTEYHYENPGNGTGGMVKVEKIHFSVSTSSEILPFTKEFILKSFPESNKLRMWLFNSASKVGDLLQKDNNGKLLIQNLVNS